MLGSLYTALAGLNAYSQGLEVISNNVANLNTPGFKVSEPLFREIVYQHLQAADSRDARGGPGGAGVEAGSTTLSFRQGTLRDTDSPLNAAIDGSGFFVLEQNGERRYTRSGQFSFNDEGTLVELGSGAQVVVSTAASAQGAFNINSSRTFAPRATREVTLRGTLTRTGDDSHELSNIVVFDAAGTRITLHARLTRIAPAAGEQPLGWRVEVLDSDDQVLSSQPAEIRFNADGTPASGASSVTVSVNSSNAADFDVVLNFGAPGSFTGVRSPPSRENDNTSNNSQVQILRQDGVQAGSLQRAEFDENGILKLTYTNGETVDAATLVLAQFNVPQKLLALGDGLFAASEDTTPLLGKALDQGLGSIAGGRLESSNVELTQQFTDLIIMQRGYQASSQVSSVTNELIQTLLAMDGNR